AERLDHLLPPRRRIRHAHTRDDGVLMDVQCCTSLDHDLHTSPPAVRRSLIPWSLRFVLAATVSDARGSRVLLRHGLGGTKPARRHRTTGGIFIRLGWALKEPMHYFASRGTPVARGTTPSRSRLAPTRDMSLGSRRDQPRPEGRSVERVRDLQVVRAPRAL